MAPDEAQRGRLEDLEGDLPLTITSIDPANLVAQLESMGDAGAVIVAWDLGGRSGLELVESLVEDPRTAGARFAMASEAPTRGMVQAAFRAGATGFLFRPYDAEAVGRFIGAGAETGAEAAEAGAEAAEAGAEAAGTGAEAAEAGAGAAE